jgi:hypothetical protein
LIVRAWSVPKLHGIAPFQGEGQAALRIIQGPSSAHDDMFEILGIATIQSMLEGLEGL